MAMIRSLRLGRTNHLGRYGSEQAVDHDEAQRGAGVISAKETRPRLGEVLPILAVPSKKSGPPPR